MSNWESHLRGLGPSFMKFWTCGRSPRSGSQNARTRIKNVNGASRLSNFRNCFGAMQIISCRAPLVTMDETWLYHYDPEQGNNQWSGGIATHPTPPQKITNTKISWKISRFEFLGSKWNPPHWLYSKRSSYQHGVLHISAGADKVHFKEKAPTRKCPASPITGNPEETGLPGLQMC